MTRVRVRWAIPSDFARMVAIDHASAEYPWGEAGFLRRLRRNDCIAMVAEAGILGGGIVGFMAYHMRPSKIVLLNLAVDPAMRREGVGRQMLARLAGKLTDGARLRDRIILRVRESAVPAQLFFRAAGYKAVGVHRGFYPDSGEDAYAMEYLSPIASLDEYGWPAARHAEGPGR